MSAQLGLGFEVIVDPHAGDEKRLTAILGIVREFEGEDDFWEDHATTAEIANRLDMTTRKAATFLAELRARGVVFSHGTTWEGGVFGEPVLPTTAWGIDDSPRPRAAPRRRIKGRLPLRLDEVEL